MSLRGLMVKFGTIGIVLTMVLTLTVPNGNVLADEIWTIENVDISGSAGNGISLTLDPSGNSHISYIDNATDHLTWAWNGGTGWNIATLDQAIGSTSMAFDPNGAAHIAYCNLAYQLYLKSYNLQANKWRPNLAVDTSGNQFGWVSLRFDASGNERLSYADMTNGDLKFAHWNGASFNVEAIDAIGTVGEFTSMASSPNGSVFISYYDRTNGDLKLAYSPDLSNWTLSTVDQVGDVGQYTSLKLDSNGLPRISYYDATNGDLKYARMISWGVWSLRIVDGGTADVGTWTSLVIDTNDNARFSYMDNQSKCLKYAWQIGDNIKTMVIDPSPMTGYYGSMVLTSSNELAIAYGDRSNGYTKYASNVNEGKQWAPTFTSVPADGRETLPYEYVPSFNETVWIDHHDTNAPFLTWNGSAYQGTPGTEGAGSYWMNIIATSVDGGMTASQNSTFTIGDTWAAAFTSIPAQGMVGIAYEYRPIFNESAMITAQSTNAPFLAWNGGAYTGTPGLEEGGNYWLNITATAVAGLLSSYQNASFLIGDGWAPTFTNAPGDGQEAVPYEHRPTFNETVSVTAHSTNAPFLAWSGEAFAGTPGTQHAGTYWMNITAVSLNGKRSSWQNSTFIIAQATAPMFISIPEVQGRELSPYSYAPLCNEIVAWTVATSAPFLTWDGSMYSGTPNTDQAGTYWVHIGATSSDANLTAWQNYTLTIADTWPPSFTNAPMNGRADHPYSYVPTFNETVSIIVHSTNAHFLTWDGSGYSGTPDIDDEGTFWIDITATSLAGLLSSHQNTTFLIAESWAPAFTNFPGDGYEAVPYEYVPTFNEATTITAYSTNAPFLTWSDDGYSGLPEIGEAGTYWINITASSSAGYLSAYQNSTFSIFPADSLVFLSAPPEGPFFATLNYQYAVEVSQPCDHVLDTNATFLSLLEGVIAGELKAGNYYVHIQAISLATGLSDWQNYTLQVITDHQAPVISVIGLSNGARLNSSSVELVLSSSDVGGSGGVNYWVKVNAAPWTDLGHRGRVTLLLGEGSSLVQVKAMDMVGNEAFSNLTLYVDTVTPNVLHHSLVGASVPSDGVLILTFSEPMDQENVMVTVDGMLVVLHWESNTALYAPPGGWLEGSDHEVRVNGMDLSGNHLPGLTWSFRIGMIMFWVNGTVLDGFGDPVANAKLIIDGSVVATTDLFGNFSFLIAPGTYRVTVSGEGLVNRTVEMVAMENDPQGLELSMAWVRGELPWTIWLPLPFFLLQVVLVVLYKRRHP